MPASAAPLRVAHIGAGRFSREWHAPALQRLTAGVPPRLVLAGISDLDPARPERAASLAREFRYGRAFTDWRDMIAEVRPDLFVCTVQPSMTSAVLVDLLPRGIPILVEKPQALTMTEAGRLAELATAHRTPTYVAFNRRRMPMLELARTWAREHAPVRHIRVEMLRTRAIAAGFCVLTAVHAFDTVRYLAGEVVEMHTYRRRSPTGRGTDYLVRLHLAAGGVADVIVSGERTSDRESYVLDSDARRLEVSVSAPYSHGTLWAGVRVFHENRMVEELAAPDDPLVAAGILPQYETFLSCIDDGGASDCSVADARHSLQIAIAAESGHCGPLADVAA